MPSIYTLTGFNDYMIRNGVLYRKAYKTPSKSCKWQYREERQIKRVLNNGIEGYNLYRNGKRKFYSLQSLKHRLKQM